MRLLHKNRHKVTKELQTKKYVHMNWLYEGLNTITIHESRSQRPQNEDKEELKENKD